jgi:hypothetical protein
MICPSGLVILASSTMSSSFVKMRSSVVGSLFSLFQVNSVTCWYGQLSLIPSVNISHFNLFLRNHWTNCNQTLVEWSLDGPLSKMCPVIPTSNQDGRQVYDLRHKYNYKYFIGTNTITIIGKGSKWSYSSCLWIENTIICHYGFHSFPVVDS